PLKDMFPKGSNHEIYDLYLELRYKNIVRRRKIGRAPYVYLKDGVLAETERTIKWRKQYVRHYLTYTPMGNLKLETFKLNHAKIKYLKKGQYKDYAAYSHQDIWLIGERPDTAQDTGYHFFKFCRRNYP